MTDFSHAVCASCGTTTSFEPGFIEDSGEGSRGYARWIPGPLERGVFGGAKRLGKTRFIIETVRCTQCGYLALFAREPI